MNPLTIAEAAALLGCTSRQILDALAVGELEVANPAGSPGPEGVKITAASFEKFAAGRG